MLQQLYLTILLLYVDYVAQSTTQEIYFVIAPESRAVLLERDFRLDCTAFEATNARLRYEWEFNGQPVYQSAIAKKVADFGNHSLLIKDADESVLGRYRCVVAPAVSPSSAEKSPEASIVKAYIDSFLIAPGSVNVTEGERVRLTCTTGYSAPPAAVHWERDGNRVSDPTEEVYFSSVRDGKARQKTSTLEFVATPQKAGSYYCVARNSLSNLTVNSEAAEVAVQALRRSPEITSTSGSNQIAPEARPFLLNCTATGFPPPEVLWYRNDTPVAITVFQYILPNGSLYFEVLPRNATGSYRCEATNSLGRVRSQPINLTVAYLDFNFRERPRDTLVMTGNYVTLTCMPPLSVPPSTVLWYKDDGSNAPALFSPRGGPFPVRQTTQGDLYFANVQFDDSGQYFCVAYNEHAVPSSRTSPSASLMVEGTPVLVEPPVPQELIKGQLLHLKCFVRSIPSAVVTWHRDEVQLIEGARIGIRNGSQELLISSVNKGDEGQYWCQANNSVGSIASSRVAVRIQVPPEFVQSVPAITTAVLGSTALIRCEVFGDPAPTVVWYRGCCTMLPPGGRYENTNVGLKIQSVTLTDESEYTCEASNAAGSSRSTGRLVLSVPPRISSLTSTEGALEGRGLAVRCDAVGTPDPTFGWRFNGSSSLPSGIRVSDGGRRLTSDSAALHQSGVYSCVATNSAGVDQEDLLVTVFVPPVIDQVSGSTAIDQGGSLELACHVAGVPEPGVTWVKDGATLQATPDSRVSFPSRRSLRILFVTKDDAGSYSCRAQSQAGSDAEFVDVRVREVPLAPTLTTAVAVSMTSVNLTWHQPEASAVSNFLIQYKLRIEDRYRSYRDDIPGDARSHEVDGLRPFTDYVFRVAGINDLGVGKYSNVLGARTLETAPSPPRNLKDVFVNATAVQLQWEVPAQTNGNLRTYQLQYKRAYVDEEYVRVNIEPPSLPRQLHTVAPLLPYTTYEFRVRGATIENGVTLWGEFSVAFTLTTAANAPGQPPQNVQVRVLSPVAIHVSWEPIPQDQENGPLRGYKVLYKPSSETGSVSEVVASVESRSVDITPLKPWTTYDIWVAAYNDIGSSDTSLKTTVRTLPTAPTGYPGNLRIVEVSNTSAVLSWEPVEKTKRNSEISGYLIQISNGQNTKSEYVNSPSTVQLQISDLEPFTEYTVRIQAFTTQVSNGGFGVLGPPVSFRTGDGLPGAVANSSLSAVADTHSISLSWSPPPHPNGRIIKYVVTIRPPPRHGNDVVDKSAESGSPRRRRQVNSDGQSFELETTDTSITIRGLEPRTMYTLTVTAETSAGRGTDVAAISIQTEAVQVTTTAAAVTSEGAVATTTTTLSPGESTAGPVPGGSDVGAQSDGLSDGELAGVVVGSVTAGVLLVLLILLLCCCLRRRNQQQHSASKNGMYYYSKDGGVIPPTTFTRESIAEINANTLELQQNVVNTGHDHGVDIHTVSGERLSDHASASTGYRSQRAAPSDANTSAFQARLDLLRDGRDSFAPSLNSTPHMRVARSEFERGAFSNIAYTPGDENVHIPSVHSRRNTGLDNPAYEPDKSADAAAFSRGYLMPTLSPEQNAEVNVSTRRKNRMKRDTAAIIAAQRDRATSVFDDTQELIEDDSVIVYDERTVL